MASAKVLVLSLCIHGVAALAQAGASSSAVRAAAIRPGGAAMTIPTELTEAKGEWTRLFSPPISSLRSDGAELMESVLGWLPQMLQAIDIGDEDGEPEEDDDFVSAARPWLHTDGFAVVQGASHVELCEQIWENLSGADCLKTGGGSFLLLVPDAAGHLRDFNTMVDVVQSAARSNLNEAVTVTACHPEAERVIDRCPVPVMLVFLDDPDLLVKGGSMSDMGQFL